MPNGPPHLFRGSKEAKKQRKTKKPSAPNRPFFLLLLMLATGGALYLSTKSTCRCRETCVDIFVGPGCCLGGGWRGGTNRRKPLLTFFVNNQFCQTFLLQKDDHIRYLFYVGLPPFYISANDTHSFYPSSYAYKNTAFNHDAESRPSPERVTPDLTRSTTAGTHRFLLRPFVRASVNNKP